MVTMDNVNTIYMLAECMVYVVAWSPFQDWTWCLYQTFVYFMSNSAIWLVVICISSGLVWQVWASTVWGTYSRI